MTQTIGSLGGAIAIRQSTTVLDGKPMVLAEDPATPGLIGYGANSDEAVQMLHTLRDVMLEQRLQLRQVTVKQHPAPETVTQVFNGFGNLVTI